MAHAELDVVNSDVDSKYAAGAKAAARRIAEAALKSAFTPGAPNDTKQRFWSVDLNVVVEIDGRKMSAGCGVIANIKQGSKKVLHLDKPPNNAATEIDPAKLEQAAVDSLVGEATEVAIKKMVAQPKANASVL